MSYRGFRFRLLCAVLAGFFLPAVLQALVVLPGAAPERGPVMSNFQFVSDGPIGSGWSRPQEIPCVYFKESLPALFRRTLVLDQDIAERGKLSWIFTGPRGGFTVELSPTALHVFERYYDSYGFYIGQSARGSFPERIGHESEVFYSGHARVITVVVDSHLSLKVYLNQQLLVEQSFLLDVTRHQLMFSAPRSEHDVLTGTLQTTPAGESVVTVNASKTYQIMWGFGGSPSIPAYAELSEEGKQEYWKILKRYNLLVDREYPMGTRLNKDMSNLDNLDDASPHYYGDNFPNGEVSNFDYNRKALEIGGKVVYEMWALPKWATQEYKDNAGKAHDGVANLEEYARAMVTYCRMEKERTGAPPDVVGVQNEVTQPKEIALLMVRTLRRELDKAGFSSVRIHMADAPFLRDGIKRAKELQEDTEVWKSIDYAASHVYDFQAFMANPDLYDERLRAMHEASQGKPFLSTEICVNDPKYQEPSYRIALNVGQLYHKNLVLMDSIGLLYCWVILDVEQPNFGASRSLLVPDRSHNYFPVASSFELRVLGAYSRHILAGMKRVEAASTNPDLLVSAYQGSGGQSTLVILNRSIEPQRIKLLWDGISWKEIERTSQYMENATASMPKELMVEPGEIVTLSTVSE